MGWPVLFCQQGKAVQILNSIMDLDYIFCECDESAFHQLIQAFEKQLDIELIKKPEISMTVIHARDTVEGQEFILGEALTTQTEVLIQHKIGYGVCLGDAPQRAYGLAILDALRQIGGPLWQQALSFAQKEAIKIQQQTFEDQQRIMTTKVDFKLMEEE